MSDATNEMGCAGSHGKQALEQFQQDAQNLILVEFVAPHCASCETLAPVLEQLAAEHLGKIHLVKIDMTEEVELAIELGVRNAPTVIFLQGKTVLEKVGGLKPKKFYAEMMQKFL